ncbi:MAG: TolC family protein [Betaproteobacteria bacterium]|nr:TolC family protein [Betaproteobacteria bacterium]
MKPQTRFALVAVAALSAVSPETQAQVAGGDRNPPSAGVFAERPAAPQTAVPLGQLVSEALQNNPEIRAARKEVEAAQARISPAGALDDPMLEAGVINLPVDSRRFDREDMTMKMIGLAQRFPYPGKRGLRQDMASKDAESLAYGYQETVNKVVRDVKLAYFDLALVMDSKRLVEKNRSVLDQFLKVAEARYAVGQGSQADVLKAQTQLSKMLDELIRLDRERPMIEADLSRTLGRGSNPAPVIPQTPGPGEVALSLDALRQAGLRDRPQLRALQSLVARNDKALELARKDFYPDFDVRLQYGQRDNMPDGTKREDMVSVIVAINLPLWREAKLDPRLSEAAAMRDQALNMLQAQQNELFMKLRQQVAGAEQNLKSARLYETGILPQARLAVEATLAAYKVGRADFLSLMDSQMTVFNYEIVHAAALINYNKALAEVDFLVGKPGL